MIHKVLQLLDPTWAAAELLEVVAPVWRASKVPLAAPHWVPGWVRRSPHHHRLGPEVAMWLPLPLGLLPAQLVPRIGLVLVHLAAVKLAVPQTELEVDPL